MPNWSGFNWYLVIQEQKRSDITDRKPRPATEQFSKDSTQSGKWHHLGENKVHLSQIIPWNFSIIIYIKMMKQKQIHSLKWKLRTYTKIFPHWFSASMLMYIPLHTCTRVLRISIRKKITWFWKSLHLWFKRISLDALWKQFHILSNWISLAKSNL